MTLEKMDDFFERRVRIYDGHMLENVAGCREGYQRVADLLPPHIRTLLDLGCGTGLELEPVFQKFPSLQVTGVDLTQKMLDALL